MNNDNFSKDLGEWLTEQRKRAKLTQQQVADRMGCANTRISNWEKGIREMNAKDLVQYCEIINADMDELVDFLRRI